MAPQPSFGPSWRLSFAEGQFSDAIQRILESYFTNLTNPRQNSARVSGFFGSGKSHLLKMLEHLWVNTPFPDGSTARSLVRGGLPSEIKALLRELDTHAVQSGKPVVAAAGTLLGGSVDHVRRTVLSIILRARGLPTQYPQAMFCFWLRDQGTLDSVRTAVQAIWKRLAKRTQQSLCEPGHRKGPDPGRSQLCHRRERLPSSHHQSISAAIS